MFFVGQRVRIINEYDFAHNKTGIVSEVEVEPDGYYDENDNFVDTDSFVNYHVIFDTPVHSSWSDTFQESGYYTEQCLMSLERVKRTSGFGKFMRAIEGRNE